MSNLLMRGDLRVTVTIPTATGNAELAKLPATQAQLGFLWRAEDIYAAVRAARLSETWKTDPDGGEVVVLVFQLPRGRADEL